jgi:hypothetical protein
LFSIWEVSCAVAQILVDNFGKRNPGELIRFGTTRPEGRCDGAERHNQVDCYKAAITDSNLPNGFGDVQLKKSMEDI